MTGILTMAVVVVAGLVISARNPRPQSAAGQGIAAVAANRPVRPHDSAVDRPATSVSGALATSSHPSKDSPRPVTTESAQIKAPPVSVAWQAPATPAVREASVDAPAANVLPHSQTKQPPAAPSPRAADRAVPASVAAQPSPAPDAAKHAAFVRAAGAVRASMAKRDLAAVKQTLLAATVLAQDPADQAELERLGILQDHLEQYWSGIGSAVAAMRPIDEIVLSESNRVAVIEASRTELAVQWEGRAQRFRIKAIPRELLWAITKNSFKPTAGSKLIVGAFLAMDASGDRAQAAKLWQDAIKSGEEEGKVLMPELEVPRGGR
jgi:hypothetical protein